MWPNSIIPNLTLHMIEQSLGSASNSMYVARKENLLVVGVGCCIVSYFAYETQLTNHKKKKKQMRPTAVRKLSHGKSRLEYFVNSSTAFARAFAADEQNQSTTSTETQRRRADQQHLSASLRTGDGPWST